MNGPRPVATRVRLHVATPFESGSTLVLPAAAARHVQVLRLQPGAALALFNGRDDAEWSATVLRMSRSEVEVQVDAAQAVDRELRVDVTIALGMPANDRMDALVEKACELGAAAIQPLLCERSVLRLSGERAEARRRHWYSVAAAASEQCGRTRVAEIMAVRALPEWLATLREGDAAATQRLVLSLDGDAVPLAAVVGPQGAASLAAADPGAERPRVVVLSGPEGGLSLAEEDAAVAAGFIRVGLGPRVLRADTAPLALLAWLGLHGAEPGE